jgi:CRP-like cAMP-binding protein
MRTLPCDIRELGLTPICRDLSFRELEAAARFGMFLDRNPGELLCPLGHDAGQICVVVSGVATESTHGRRRFLRRGDCFGSLEVEPSSAEPVELRAATAVTMFVVGRRDLMNLRNVCPRLAARLVGEHEVAAATAPAPVASPAPVLAPPAYLRSPAIT